MTEEHRRHAVERFLATRELPLDQALDLAQPTEQQPATEPDHQTSHIIYDTALDATEGLWLRAGWAGRE